MAKKLYYFNLNALGESIRLILHYGGHEFEDVRYDRNAWPIKEIKDNLPYGKVPVYEEGDRKLTQSIAIAKYVGAQSGLVPADPWEQAVLDAAVLTVYDLWQAFLPSVRREPDLVKREENRKKAIAETVPYYLSRFEKELKTNNGHFGKKLSWADFVFVGLMEATDLFLGVEAEKDYPTISALIAEIRALPGVKEYIKNRPVYVLPK